MSTTMTEKVMNLQDTIAALDKIVKEVGNDYAYVRPEGASLACLYWHPDPEGQAEGEPGCIVGRLLFEHGLKWYEVCNLDGKGSVRGVSHYLENYGIRFTEGALLLLAEVQNRQDNGVPWAQAVAYGKGYVTAATDEARLGSDE